MSPLLQEFYDEMYLAINGKQPVWFLHSAGLCLNLRFFLDSKKIVTQWPICQELRDQLKDSFPFNKDFTDFFRETDKYSNTLRVQWIKEHITKVPLWGLPNPDRNKCSIERLGICGCAFGQCAKGLIY